MAVAACSEEEHVMANGYTRQKASAAAKKTGVKICCGTPAPVHNKIYSKNNASMSGKQKGY